VIGEDGIAKAEELPMKRQLDERVAIVTCGGREIGEAICLAFAREGALGSVHAANPDARLASLTRRQPASREGRR
jgi:NAD(P)-dependent dehydrogenase (short-subunit alcohol dehydrogenase family)